MVENKLIHAQTFQNDTWIQNVIPTSPGIGRSEHLMT